MAKPSKKGLGRGLDALLESYEPGKNPASLQEVSVYDIDTNPDQPRKTFDEEKLRELAASIKTHGIVQPLILYRQGTGTSSWPGSADSGQPGWRGSKPCPPSSRTGRNTNSRRCPSSRTCSGRT